MAVSDSLFKEGGPLNIKRTGRGEFEARIDIPPDADGMIGQECPDEECSPAYFKVKDEIGASEDDERGFCPYCRCEADSDEFYTEAQLKYAEDLVEREAEKGVDRMIEKSFGLGPSGRKKIDLGLLSVEISLESGRLPPVIRPVGEELRRDVVCPVCGLEHAVFGMATWCPSCGSDIFMAHVEQEYNVVRSILGEVDAWKEKLGARIAARDLENCLEDVVSIFEAVLRILTRRCLHDRKIVEDEIEEIMKKRVGNRYQNVQFARDTFKKVLDVELFEGFEDKDVEKLRLTFEKRHPITHNLGIIDRKYLEKARSGELEGREVPINASEVIEAIDLCYRVLKGLHNRLFGRSKK